PCCIEVVVQIQNADPGGQISFDPCVLKTSEVVTGCAGKVIECEIYGLRESCARGDVIISVAPPGAASGDGVLTVPGGPTLLGDRGECVFKPCVPTTQCTVLGIKSDVCKSMNGCDDLVPLASGGVMRPTEMQV